MSLHNPLESKELPSWTATRHTNKMCALDNGNIAILSPPYNKVEIRSGIDGSPIALAELKDENMTPILNIISAGSCIICIGLSHFTLLDAANGTQLGSGKRINSFATHAIRLPDTTSSFAILNYQGKLSHILDLSTPATPLVKPLLKTSLGRRPDSLAVLPGGRMFFRDADVIEEAKEEKIPFPCLSDPSITNWTDEARHIQMVSLAKDHLAILWRSQEGEVTGHIYNMTEQTLVTTVKFIDTHLSKSRHTFGVSTMFDNTVLVIEEVSGTIHFWNLTTQKQYDVFFGSFAKVLGDKVIQLTGDPFQPTYVIHDAARLKNLLMTALTSMHTHFPPVLRQLIIHDYLPGFSFFSKDKKLEDIPETAMAVTPSIK